MLDGLERVLAAYHRSDAAQLRDEQVQEDGDTGLVGRKPQDCIRPDDDDLLRHLAAAAPSKLLISSRLMPRALLNASGEPVPGVQRMLLHGLAPADAEAMLTGIGIRGDSARMRQLPGAGVRLPPAGGRVRRRAGAQRAVGAAGFRPLGGRPARRGSGQPGRC